MSVSRIGLVVLLAVVAAAAGRPADLDEQRPGQSGRVAATEHPHLAVDEAYSSASATSGESLHTSARILCSYSGTRPRSFRLLCC